MGFSILERFALGNIMIADSFMSADELIAVDGGESI